MNDNEKFWEIQKTMEREMRNLGLDYALEDIQSRKRNIRNRCYVLQGLIDELKVWNYSAYSDFP